VLAAWRKERAEKRRQDPMQPRAVEAERVVARKPHATSDGAGMGVAFAALPLRVPTPGSSAPPLQDLMSVSCPEGVTRLAMCR